MGQYNDFSNRPDCPEFLEFSANRLLAEAGFTATPDFLDTEVPSRYANKFVAVLSQTNVNSWGVVSTLKSPAELLLKIMASVKVPRMSISTTNLPKDAPRAAIDFLSGFLQMIAVATTSVNIVGGKFVRLHPTLCAGFPLARQYRAVFGGGPRNFG
jgi:hypothetical protein